MSLIIRPDVRTSKFSSRARVRRARDSNSKTRAGVGTSGPRSKLSPRSFNAFSRANLPTGVKGRRAGVTACPWASGCSARRIHIRLRYIKFLHRRFIESAKIQKLGTTSEKSTCKAQKISAPPAPLGQPGVYRLALATRSISSFFLIAYELLLPFDALIISSARHSAHVLMLRKLD